jgi:hypothetical protein
MAAISNYLHISPSGKQHNRNIAEYGIRNSDSLESRMPAGFEDRFKQYFNASRHGIQPRTGSFLKNIENLKKADASNEHLMEELNKFDDHNSLKHNLKNVKQKRMIDGNTLFLKKLKYF